MVRQYYQLAKPGIIYGNLLNAAAGFLFAASLAQYFDAVLFGAVMVGIGLVIASACVVNNVIDRGIDTHMARTKTRGLVTGAVTVPHALTYAVVLGIAGFTVLTVWTNALTVLLGAVAVFSYLVPYSITKRRTEYGTIVGSIPGALPPVAAYCALVGGVDPAALLLFFIFALWQMPHFYAIAMYRAQEYAAAGLPVLPVKRGMRVARAQTLAYIGTFLVLNMLLVFYGYVGYSYGALLAFVCLYWLYKGLFVLAASDDTTWGRQMFLLSLKVVLVLDVLLSIGPLLP